jgi:hypothetical protein
MQETSMKHLASLLPAKQVTDSKQNRNVATRFMLVYFLVYSSTLKTEVTCSSETSVDFRRTTRQYSLDDINLLHCCKLCREMDQ